ncbi:MAG: proline iminopeptidase-family hydrolase [Synergistaceae bacterium]|jgi:proline-specific peptidase|nr:proline iminopeptidase-family hydrolase [Synergistaceae bacterium]
MLKIIEGFMPFGGSQTYYRIAGDKTDRLPLLTFHGGPGASHSYLLSLDDLAGRGRQVIYYDQTGCGKSPAPSDPGRWTPELFVEEAQALQKHLRLDEFHLLGQSWGGMLAIYFAHTRPKGLTSVTLASSPVSIPQWNEESARLLSEMPEGPRAALEHGEATGERDTQEYRDALDQFYLRHLCRMETMPDYVLASFAQMGEVYHTLQGDSELRLTGTLKDVDLTPLLAGIGVPALITAGQYDQCTGAVVKTLLDHIPDARAVVFKDSGHLAHVEKREAYNRTLEAFLEEVEAKSTRP